MRQCRVWKGSSQAHNDPPPGDGQLGRWMTEAVYKHLLRRSVIAARGRSARRQPASRPKVRIAARRITVPADGVVEATVILTGAARTRAVAIRLEGIDRRWRATALHVL